MKVRVEVVDFEGTVFVGETVLTPLTKRDAKSPFEKQQQRPEPVGQAPDFSLPFRAFISRYAPGMTGSKKFTLVLAYTVKGKVGAEQDIASILSAWRAKKGVLGEFNTGHATRAKDRAWVDSTKKGTYVLMPSWVEILDGHVR